MLPWVCLGYAAETIKRIDVLAGGEHDETKRKRAADETRRGGSSRATGEEDKEKEGLARDTGSTRDENADANANVNVNVNVGQGEGKKEGWKTRGKTEEETVAGYQRTKREEDKGGQREDKGGEGGGGEGGARARERERVEGPGEVKERSVYEEEMGGRPSEGIKREEGGRDIKSGPPKLR